MYGYDYWSAAAAAGGAAAAAAPGQYAPLPAGGKPKGPGRRGLYLGSV